MNTSQLCKTLKNVIYMFLITFILASCGQFAYKRGASASNFDKDKAYCEGHHQSVSEVESCLKSRGWYVQSLDNFEDSDLFATASVSDNRQGAPSGEAKKTSQQTNSQKTNGEEVSSEQDGASKAKLENSATDRQAKMAEKHDPLETYAISSWWKMGAGPLALEKNTNECLASLGPAHQPNFKTQLYTRGMIVCMRQKGWRALKR